MFFLFLQIIVQTLQRIYQMRVYVPSYCERSKNSDGRVCLENIRIYTMHGVVGRMCMYANNIGSAAGAATCSYNLRSSKTVHSTP